jgi:hypothetical protein
VLLALPQSPNETVLEYDAASLSSSGLRLGQEKPFQKLILDGDVALNPMDAIPDVIGKVPPDFRESNASNMSGVEGYNLHPSTHYYTSTTLGLTWADHVTIIGWTRSGRTTLGYTGEGLEFLLEFDWNFQQDSTGKRLAVDIGCSMTYDSFKNPYAKNTASDPLRPVYPSVSGTTHIESIDKSRPYYCRTTRLVDPYEYDSYWADGRLFRHYAYGSSRRTSTGWLTRRTGVSSSTMLILDPAWYGKYNVLSKALSTISSDLYATLYDSTRSSTWSDLQETAIQSSIIISNNMFMFVQDVANLKKDFENLAQSGKRLGRDVLGAFSVEEANRELSQWAKSHGKQLIQDLDNVYLPLKYGYGLTVSEAHELGHKLLTLKQKYQSLFSGKFQMRARKTISTGVGSARVNYLANVKVQDNKFSKLYALIFNSGFWPTLSTAYDYIPYSFCVDWFVSIGDLLGQIDLYGYRCNMQLLSKVKSVIVDNGYMPARTLIANSPAVPESVMVAISYYKRWIEDQWDSPPFKLDVPLIGMSPGKFSHYTEATALLTQRL